MACKRERVSVSMDETTVLTMAEKILAFLTDVILPGGTKIFEWVTTTDGINYFFYMSILYGIVALFTRIKNAVR